MICVGNTNINVTPWGGIVHVVFLTDDLVPRDEDQGSCGLEGLQQRSTTLWYTMTMGGSTTGGGKTRPKIRYR